VGRGVDRARDLHLDHRIAEAEIACKTAKDRGRGRVEVYQDTDQSMISPHDEIGLIGSVREALRTSASSCSRSRSRR
jgi:hypothetical protein